MKGTRRGCALLIALALLPFAGCDDAPGNVEWSGTLYASSAIGWGGHYDAGAGARGSFSADGIITLLVLDSENWNLWETEGAYTAALQMTGDRGVFRFTADGPGEYWLVLSNRTGTTDRRARIETRRLNRP